MTTFEAVETLLVFSAVTYSLLFLYVSTLVVLTAFKHKVYGFTFLLLAGLDLLIAALILEDFMLLQLTKSG